MEEQLGWTTIEQSKQLMEAGLKPDTADMFYAYDYNKHMHNTTPNVLITKNWDDEYNMSIPCWSLGRLCVLMPKYLKAGNHYFDLVLKPGVCPACQYIDLAVNSSKERTYMESKMKRTLMDSVISMIERLLACKSTYLTEVKSGLI